LIQRVEALPDPSEAEVIFALSGDVEGESTAFYIYRKLSHTGVRFSSLARGLGFGDDLEYADELTLGRSIVNRQEFKP
jgi:recombination protein RecR